MEYSNKHFSKEDRWLKSIEYYSTTKRNKFESVELMWMNLEPVTQSEVSQKEKNKYNILTHTHIWNINDADEPICRARIDTNI